MKKIFYLLLVTCYLLLAVKSYAITSSSPTPTSESAIQQQLDELKDRIASRVAQLKLVERRGVVGTVTDVSDTQITLKDIHGNTRFVDVDELTKFVGNTKSGGTFGISDINKGDDLAVMGLYNKQSRRILARVVETNTNPKVAEGYIATLDSANFVANIATDKGDQVPVEFETTTKTFSFTKSGGKLIKSGFSKLVQGELIFVIGFPDKTVKNQINADRIIALPDFVKTPGLPPAASIVPSTGSGRKLTPITK